MTKRHGVLTLSLILVLTTASAFAKEEKPPVTRDVFTQLTSLYKNWNYSAPDSPDYDR